MRKPISIAMCVESDSVGYAIVCDDGKMYMRWDNGLESGNRWAELPDVPQEEMINAASE